MKSVSKNNDLELTQFPKLMEDKEAGLIILMTSKYNGTVVHCKNGFIVGYSGVWNYELLTTYTGTIELSNL